MSKQSLTRRDFLKKTGVTIAGVGLSTFLTDFASRGQTTEINFLCVQDPMFFSYETLLPDFEKETGIKVNMEGRSTLEIHAELVSSFVAQEKGLDVVAVDQMWLSQYADNRWIVPLSEYIEKDKEEVDTSDLVPEVVYSMNEWRGEIYTFPIASYSQLAFYRKDILDQLGLEHPPKEPKDWWTWDKYMEYVRKIDEQKAADGTVIVGAAPVPIVHMYTQLAASKGTRWFEQFPEGPWDFTPIINSDANLDALEFYKELYEHSPAESISYVWFDAGTAFSTKDIGMYYWWTPYAYLMRRAGYMVEELSPNYGTIDYAVLPKQPGVNQLYSLGGWSVAIPQYSSNKNAAWELVKWVGSAETQKKMGLTKPKQFSDFTRKSLYEDVELIQEYPWLPVHQKTIEQGNGKLVRPPIPIYTTLEGFYGTELNSVLAGDKSPEQALENVQSQFETVLKQNFFIPDYAGKDYDDTLANTKKLLQELAP